MQLVSFTQLIELREDCPTTTQTPLLLQPPLQLVVNVLRAFSADVLEPEEVVADATFDNKASRGTTHAHIDEDARPRKARNGEAKCGDAPRSFDLWP